MVKLSPEQQAHGGRSRAEIFRPVPGGGKSGSTNIFLAKADAVTLKSALTMACNNLASKPPAKPWLKQKSVLISQRINLSLPASPIFEHASSARLGPNRINGYPTDPARYDGPTRTIWRIDAATARAHAFAWRVLVGAGYRGARLRQRAIRKRAARYPRLVQRRARRMVCPVRHSSDGHCTSYDFRRGAYWVPIEGQWIAVPARAVIRDRGNPVGEAVVWYVRITAAASSSAALFRRMRFRTETSEMMEGCGGC